MAKVNTNELLKKHHFWILFGLSVLFVGLAFVFLSTGVSASIDTKAAANKAQVDKVNGTKPPGKGVIDGLAKQQEVLKGRKDKLWEANWEQQKGYFVWPKSVTNRQDMFDPFNKLKFGTDITKQLNDEEIQEFKRETVYQRMYEDAAAVIRPTAFGASGNNPNNWQGVLRWVKDWGPLAPTGQQLWLLMEDVWVQRAMLDPIRVTNETVTRFTPVSPDPAQPLRRLFRSRIWDLQLEVADAPGGKVFKARLVNRTPQLQLLGSNNRMVLNVRIDPNPNLPPVPLVIEGEYVPGASEYPAKAKDGKEQWAEYPVEPGRTPAELAAVEPVLDPKTVPVRRLTQLILGQLSAKHAVLLGKEGKSLEKPKFWPEAPAAAVDPNAAAGGYSSPPGGLSGTGSEGGVGRGLAGGPGAGFPGATGGPGGGGTSLAGAADANKLRYLTVTDQIRRMPVAFTVVCDQMFVQDVLIAYANSPLRFEAVQYHWRRTNAGGGGGAEGGSGSFGSAGARGGEEGYTAGGALGSGFSGAGSGSLFGPPGGSYPGAEGGGGGGYGGYGFGGGFGGFGSLLNSVSEGQANAGLVELSVYGIISLYEQYVPSDAAAAPPAAGDTPPAAAPMGDAPKADAPKADAKGETPKADAPKPDDAKGEAPKGDAPKAETPKADDKAAAPKGEAAKGESPKAGDAPKGEPNKQ